MLWVFFLAHGTHLFLFYSPKAYHSRKGHVHDYGVKREKLSAKQEIWLFFDLRLRNGQSAQRRRKTNTNKGTAFAVPVVMFRYHANSTMINMPPAW